MKVLLVGDRAREHVLAEQLARSSELYVAMQYRNPGIIKASQKCFVCDFANIEAIGSWAIREDIDVALVTSETALAKGLTDALEDIGVKIASPPGSGTVLGENALYGLNLMQSCGIPIPGFRSCKNDKELKSAMKEIPNLVIKPAVKVDWTGTRFIEADLKKPAEITKHAKAMMKMQGSVIIEEVIDGESFSVQGITDGKSLYVMPPVYIARRSLPGNQGPLTEGMGGFSNGRLLPFMKPSDMDFARDCLWRLVSAMKAKGVEYRGAIRGEFMCAKSGPMMLDIYSTFGSINTLNNFPLLRTQLGEVLASVAEGSLKPLSFMESATVAKYLVPQGYPGKAKKSSFQIDERALWNNGAKAYLESVGRESGAMTTTENRTAVICASGSTVDEANAKVEAAASGVRGGLVHRQDIGSIDFVNRTVKHLALLRASG